MYVMEKEQELTVRLFPWVNSFDVNKKEVLEISNFGPCKSLKSPCIFGLKKCTKPDIKRFIN